ncbi:hypothetical protein STEG23_023115, partial [Scotinomys teguina]
MFSNGTVLYSDSASLTGLRVREENLGTRYFRVGAKILGHHLQIQIPLIWSLTKCTATKARKGWLFDSLDLELQVVLSSQ